MRGTKEIDHVKSVVIGVLKFGELGYFEMRIPYSSYSIPGIIAIFLLLNFQFLVHFTALGLFDSQQDELASVLRKNPMV